MIRILLVDDQELVRTGFRMILDSEDDLAVVGEAADGRAALEWLQSSSCDVVLMDVRMPNLDGVEATARIQAQPDPPKVIILTTFDLDDYVFSALKNGASGFLLKDTPADDLISAISVVMNGDALLAPSVTKMLIERFQDRAPDSGSLASQGSQGSHGSHGSHGSTVSASPAESPAVPAAISELTEREHEVLIELAKGRSNSEIGEALFVAEATVKTHVGRILTKLGVRDRVQAVVAAYECGLVRPGEDNGPS